MFLWFSVLASLSLAQANESIVFMKEEGRSKVLMMADRYGENIRQITEDDRWSFYADISADGRWVAYSESPVLEGVEGGDAKASVDIGIVVVNLENEFREQWVPAKGMNLQADFSGDQRYLAFSGPSPNKSINQIGVIDLEEERAKAGRLDWEGNQMTYDPEVRWIESDGMLFFPSLSSDGSQLVFHESLSKTKRVVKYLDLSKPEAKAIVLSDPDGNSMAPAFSKDDRYVAFTSKVDGNWDVYMVDLHSRDRRAVRLTNDPSEDYAPSFTADGSVLFVSNRNGTFDVFEISSKSIQAGKPHPEELIAIGASTYAPISSGRTDIVQGKLAPIPGAVRSSFGTVNAGSKVYVSGGHIGAGHHYPKESFNSELHALNLNENTWKALENRPIAGHGYDLAEYDGGIFAFGAFTYSEDHLPRWKSLARVDRYDIENGSWEMVAELPRPRSSNVVAQVGSLAYLIGGWDSTPKTEGDMEGRFHPEIDVVDLETYKVLNSAYEMPAPLRRAFTGLSHGSKIILLGGLGEGARHFSLIDHVTVFDTKTEEWSELPRLPFATFAPAAGIIDDQLFLFGGLIATGKHEYRYVNHIYVLDLNSPTEGWRSTGRYLTEAKGFSQVVQDPNGGLVILGGHKGVEGKDLPVPTVESFELQ